MGNRAELQLGEDSKIGIYVHRNGGKESVEYFLNETKKAITNFTSGELDPRLYGRTDIEQYGNSAKYLRNVVVERYGGATRPRVPIMNNESGGMHDNTITKAKHKN